MLRSRTLPLLVDQLQKTVFADPQLELWELDDERWRKVLECAAHPRHTKLRGTSTVEQLSFHIAGLILLLLGTAQHVA